MSTTTTEIQTTLIYDDYAERTYKIPVNGEPNLTDAKDKIRAFNTAAQNDASSVKQTFVSDTGGKVLRIKEATVVRRTEEEIYSG